MLVAPEGLNLFLAGHERAVDTVLDFVRAQPGFSELRVKRSWSAHVPFARLKVKLKKEIIAFGHAACVPASPCGRGARYCRSAPAAAIPPGVSW